ncbi:hypothetical protein EYF80_002510 [Liparis tanakae]|uniref:Uncharacterized protein n=1 Tax=Liparis tanakae TaxID=230148 RepID=A0A4Z2JCG5_9TELE|nr:hypothetical protein EYF80_002510 [Liparis tanakae]
MPAGPRKDRAARRCAAAGSELSGLLGAADGSPGCRSRCIWEADGSRCSSADVRAHAGLYAARDVFTRHVETD